MGEAKLSKHCLTHTFVITPDNRAVVDVVPYYVKSFDAKQPIMEKKRSWGRSKRREKRVNVISETKKIMRRTVSDEDPNQAEYIEEVLQEVAEVSGFTMTSKL